MSTYYPVLSFIQSITRGVQTTVTFTAPCDFTPGEVVSFRVSPQSGMKELNNVETPVVSNTSNSIVVNINSTNFTPFIFHSENSIQYPAIVVPSSSGIVPGSFPIATSLVDAFDNIPNT